MYCSSVIAAGGKGTRMNMDLNKQYINVAGKPILMRTLEIFNMISQINEIILVVNKKDVDYCRENIVKKILFNKEIKIIAGGNTRQRSVYEGLKALSKECDIVVIHDGARPFVAEEIVLKSIENANIYGAACVGVPVKDTIKRVNKENIICGTPARESLWAVQTPQTFKKDIILKAHQTAIEQGFSGTDDAVLVERMKKKVKMIKGSYSNIKITTKEDLILAEKIAKKLLI